LPDDLEFGENFDEPYMLKLLHPVSVISMIEVGYLTRKVVMLEKIVNGCFARIGFVIVMLVLLVFAVIFGISVATRGFEDTFSAFINFPRDVFCATFNTCEGKNLEARLAEETIIYTKIHERTVLDLGKFERGGEWKATEDTLFITHVRRMKATVNITFGMNLGAITEEDIVVDNTTQTIQVALPPIQPVECFLENRDFYADFGEGCVDVCDDLEKKLQEMAIKRSLESEEYAQSRDRAWLDAQEQVAQLIDIGNLADIEYHIQFVEKQGDIPKIQGETCSKYQ
jgi:hypothetical protein